MAKWASERKLSAQADEQYRRVVELDPDNEEARKALNHVKENGVWVSKKEQMERRGLERYGGRDVSKQEADLLRARDAEKKEVARWRKETEALYRAAKNDDQSAADRLRRVKNPYALATLVKLYQGEKNDAEGRVLLVQAMGSIGTPAALGRLGTIALKDEDLDVRSAAIRGIDRKKLARDEAIEFFRRNLRESGDIATINRAAYALGELKAEQAIPDLVNSLITSHKRQVVVGSQQTGMTVDSSGGVSGFSPGGGGKRRRWSTAA